MSVNLILQLPKDVFEILRREEKEMNEVVRSLGHQDHAKEKEAWDATTEAFRVLMEAVRSTPLTHASDGKTAMLANGMKGA